MIPRVQSLELTGGDLTIAEVVAVARRGRRVRLAEAALERMRTARAVARASAARGHCVYGLTTGVGALRGVAVATEDADRYGTLSIDAHRAAHGAPLPDDVVRAAMLHRANALALGRAMVRPVVAEAFVDALNADQVPVVHAVSSVGQSDLPAMAEIGWFLIERGLRLEQGEALAMLNANSLSTGHAALALHDLLQLLDAYDAVLAASLEGFAANLSVLHPDVAVVRPYPGLTGTIARLRGLLEGSELWAEGAARNLQDPLSFRAAAQTHGAARDALEFARRQVEIELNASGDNPLVLPGEERLVSVGNFDITPVATALDLVRIALGQVLTLSGERVQKHLHETYSGLRTGLRADDAPDDALAIVGVGAASLAGEARLLAGPVRSSDPRRRSPAASRTI